MKHIIFIIFFAISTLTFSQGLRVDAGGNIIVQNTANVIITGNGNWTNNGTANCITGSWVRFAGNSAQLIQGSTSTAFSNVQVNNSGAGVQLGINIGVLTSLLMSQGDFDLKDYDVDLSTTGILSNEASARRVKATNGGGADGMGTGTIFATRNNPSGDVAGLGLDITPSGALGNTVLIRGHEQQAGSGSFAGNWSVFRYYEIQPTSYNNTDFDFSYYPVWELNGHIDGNLIAFQQVQYSWGGVPGPVYWTPLTTVNASPSASATSIPNILNNIRVTLGSDDIMLPVQLLSFSGNCNSNSVLLSWKTASEINNDFFELEKSANGEIFYSITSIAGAGNSNQIVSYCYTDFEDFGSASYYRLRQVDFDGKISFSPNIYVSCESEGNIHAYSIDNNSINVSFFNLDDDIYEITIYDRVGKEIVSSKVSVNQSIQLETLQLESIASGLYFINVVSNKKTYSENFLIQRD